MMGTSRAMAALVASLLLASPVLAQPKPPTDAQKQQAGDLVKKAIAKSQANDHQGAIDLYLQAYAIVPLPVLLSNIGAEYQLITKPVEALKYFCKYLEADPTGNSAQYATAQAKVLQIQLGNTAVDDNAVCAPAPVVEPPKVVVPPPPPPPPPSNAGKTLGIVGMTIGGLGVVGLGLGFYFGSQAGKISDQISNHDPMTPWPDDINALEARGASHERKQIIFLAAGGAALVGGTVLYFVARSKKSNAEHVSITPAVSPDSAGVVFSGGF